jgi:hypothetical protein
MNYNKSILNLLEKLLFYVLALHISARKARSVILFYTKPSSGTFCNSLAGVCSERGTLTNRQRSSLVKII